MTRPDAEQIRDAAPHRLERRFPRASVAEQCAGWGSALLPARMLGHCRPAATKPCTPHTTKQQAEPERSGMPTAAPNPPDQVQLRSSAEHGSMLVEPVRGIPKVRCAGPPGMGAGPASGSCGGGGGSGTARKEDATEAQGLGSGASCSGDCRLRAKSEPGAHCSRRAISGRCLHESAQLS